MMTVPTMTHLLLLLLLPLFPITSVIGMAKTTTPRKGNKSSFSSSFVELRLTRASSRNSVILIDAENVRGKSGFELSHDDLLDRTAAWAKVRGFDDRVSLIVDHGSTPDAHYLRDMGLSVVFAGPKMKADDIIARDVPFFQGTLGLDVVVVTADRELMGRCRSAAVSGGGREMQLLQPIQFLDDLEHVVSMDEEEEIEVGDNSTTTAPPVADDYGSEISPSLEEEMSIEIRLGGKLLEAEAMLRRRRMSHNKRRKLVKQINKLREKLATLGSSRGILGDSSALQRVTEVQSALMSREDQDALMARWERNRRTSKGRQPRKEVTGDRIILAERLRRRLEDLTAAENAGDVDGSGTDERDDVVVVEPAEAHAEHVNGLRALRPVSAPVPVAQPDSESPPSEPLRLVVISDTHGYETALTADRSLVPWSMIRQEVSDEDSTRASPPGASVVDSATEVADPSMTSADDMDITMQQLPPGDVLIHLGDFAVNGSPRRRRDAILVFDDWLSRQPHRHKIVLRGNHDPLEVQFPLSRATYVAKPASLTIEGWNLSLLPYAFESKRKSHSSVRVPPCDVLASHVPPKALLDRTNSGESVGSPNLRSSVERMKGGPPKFWLCGHIHESRGWRKVRFQGKGSRETVVINAANANPGRASALVHGPVVVDLCADDDQSLDVPAMLPPRPAPLVRDWGWGCNGRSASDEQAESQVVDGSATAATGNLLLAIDLGLRTGLSLYNDCGELLRYEQLEFESHEELRSNAPRLIKAWEADANTNRARMEEDRDDDDDDVDYDERRWAVTHLAVEGGDPPLWEAWRDAAAAGTAASAARQPRGGVNGSSSSATPPPRLLNIKADEWRAGLLTSKEKVSGSKAKAAARLIARQIVDDFGGREARRWHDGMSFPTDAAESVAMGFYVALQLGWVRREPPIRRYMNGGVIVPRRGSKS